MVLEAIRRLYYLRNGEVRPVTRSALLANVKLPATTVDDRLRVLRITKVVRRVRQGTYELASSPGDKPKPRVSMPKGTERVVPLDDGGVVREQWLKGPDPLEQARLKLSRSQDA